MTMTARTLKFIVACEIEGGNVTPEAIRRAIETAMQQALSSDDGLTTERDEGYVTGCHVSLAADDA
jgi:hypothetical protein